MIYKHNSNIHSKSIINMMRNPNFVCIHTYIIEKEMCIPLIKPRNNIPANPI